MKTPRPASMLYPWLVVAILMLAYVLSFVDRQILTLLVKPIRTDLAISDTQMSLLMGFSFAIFYTVCGIPLARWADRGSRQKLVIAGVLFWSLATAACGLAHRYIHLFLARIGVGIGEAALSPAAYSLITDYFPREQRATALSVYGMGIYLGSGIAYLVGGAVIQFASVTGPLTLPLFGEIRPWQVVFLILGGAGILFSSVLLLIREPARSQGHVTLPFGEVWAALKQRRRVILCHNFGFGLIALASYAAASWIPSYFGRVHGWNMAQLGFVYGIVVLIFGTLGIVSAGRIADMLIRRGVQDATMRVGLWAAIGGIPASMLYLLTTDAMTAAWLLAPATFFIAMPFGIAPAGVQEIVPPAMRAQASAVYLFIVNLIGLGMGPTAVALVTDYVFHDDAMVGQSLLIVTIVSLSLGAALLGAGLKPYREALAAQRR
ncbi:MAG: MFS transporter [Pseudomonadota bacterium]